MIRTIGCAAGQFLYELENAGSPDFLRNHPGHAATILHDAGESAKKEFEKGSPHCESPIEREMLAALLTADWRCFGDHIPRVWVDAAPASKISIIPQLKIGRRRIDFAVSVPKKPIGTVIAVECDGTDFHSAGDDRMRDVELAYFGILTVRFSGSEIKKDPGGCAARVVQLCAEWANA